MHRSTRRPLVALALLPALLLFGGCGEASDKIAEKAAEKAIENQTGGDVDIDADGGGVRVETPDGVFESDAEGNFSMESEDGTVTAGAGLPEDWPEDLPLPDGVEVVYGSSSPEGATVTLTGTGSVDDLMAEFEDLYGDWTAEDESTMESGGTSFRSARFVDGNRSLSVSVSDSGGEATAALVYTAGS